jgi:hypothetical protein
MKHMLNPWIGSALLTTFIVSVLLSLMLYHLRKHTRILDKNNKFWSKITTRPRKALFIIITVVVSFVLIVPIYRGITSILNYQYIPDGYAEWRDSNGQKYLYVQATDYYNLGYLEGKYLWREIFNFRVILMGQYIGDYEYMKRRTLAYLPFLSQDYLDEMQGMAAGASAGSGWPFTFLDILLQNTYLDIYFGQDVPNHFESEPMGCTAFGTKNNNGSVSLGQNFDFPKIMGKGDINTLSFVHTNLSGKPEIFGLRVGAMLNIPCAKTSRGVYTLVNIIESNMTGTIMMPSPLRTRYNLETAHSAEELYTMTFIDKNQSISANMMIADADTLIGIQILPNEIRSRNLTKIVNSNTYIYPDWKEKYLPLGNYSQARQQHGELLLDLFYNDDLQLTHEELIGILGNKTKAFGEGSEICRETENSRTSMTLAFFTNNGFGLGNVHDGVGALPF